MFLHYTSRAAGDSESPSLEAIHNLFQIPKSFIGDFLLRAAPSRWRGSAMSLPSLLSFMKVMKQLLWELKIFHQAYTFPAKSAKAMLKLFKEKEDLFFKCYLNWRDKTVMGSIERSFSKLKLVMSRLKSLCGQHRLSDLRDSEGHWNRQMGSN